MSFPTERPRRLRRTQALRRMVRETRLSVDDLVLPLFVRSGEGLREPIEAMPGVARLSVDQAVKDCELAQELGIPAVIFFGIPDRKDPVPAEWGIFSPYWYGLGHQVCVMHSPVSVYIGTEIFLHRCCRRKRPAYSI